MTKEILGSAEQKMKKSLETLQHELASIRTGKATTALLDNIKVDAYGQLSPLKQVGNVGVIDSKTLSVQVWDRALVPVVEKAIREAGMGLNPAAEGQTIRVPIPPLTEDRRKEYVKLVKKIAEDGKVALRNIRRDSIQSIEKAEKEKIITEDDKNRGKKDADALTQRYEKMIDDSVQRKEKEIMEV
ncbi:MAG: ribosome recycling factor [[Candidatus Thermochlorobacteriaceae] bacterium GBChlB]|nr:MAG: ribosome recycling factor [[Candidatus Thermochlorobacteriaceae] bacterium GBChlB]